MLSEDRSPSGTCAHPLQPLITPKPPSGGDSPTPSQFRCGAPQSSSSADRSPGVSPEKSPPLPSHNNAVSNATSEPLPGAVFYNLWSCSICSFPPYLEFPASFIRCSDLQPSHNFFQCRTARRNAVQFCFEFAGMCHAPMAHPNWFLGATLGEVYDFIESVGAKFLAYIMPDYDPQHSAIFNRVNVRLRVFFKESGVRQTPAIIEYPDSDPALQAQYNAYPCRKVGITPGRAVVVSLIDTFGPVENVWDEYLLTHPGGFPAQNPHSTPVAQPSPRIPSSSSSTATATPIATIKQDPQPHLHQHQHHQQNQQQRVPTWVGSNPTPVTYNQSPPSEYADPTSQPAYTRGPFIRINGELVQMPNLGRNNHLHQHQHRIDYCGSGYESTPHASSSSSSSTHRHQSSSVSSRHHEQEFGAAIATPTRSMETDSPYQQPTNSSPPIQKDRMNSSPIRNSSGYSGTEWFAPGNIPRLTSQEDQKVERRLQALKAEHAFLASQIEAAKAKLKGPTPTPSTTTTMGATVPHDDDDSDSDSDSDTPPPMPQTATQGGSPNSKSSHTATATPTPSKKSTPACVQQQRNQESHSPTPHPQSVVSPRPTTHSVIQTHRVTLDTDTLKKVYLKAKWLAYAVPTVCLRASGRDLLHPEQAVLNLLLSLGAPDRGHTSKATRLQALGRRILHSQGVTREVVKGFLQWVGEARNLLIMIAERAANGANGTNPDSVLGMARQLQRDSMTCLGTLNHAIASNNYSTKEERSRCSISLTNIPLRFPAFLLRLLLDRFGTVVNVRFRVSTGAGSQNRTTLSPVSFLKEGTSINHTTSPPTKVRDKTSHPWCTLPTEGPKPFSMAFVEYATPCEAAAALSALNGFVMGNYTLKADSVQNQSYPNGVESTQEVQYWMKAKSALETYSAAVLAPLLQQFDRPNKQVPKHPVVIEGSGSTFQFGGYSVVVATSEIGVSEQQHAVVMEQVRLPDPTQCARDVCAAIEKLTLDSRTILSRSPKATTAVPISSTVAAELLDTLVVCETSMLTSCMLTASVAVSQRSDADTHRLDTNSLLALTNKVQGAHPSINLRRVHIAGAKNMEATVKSMDSFLKKQQKGSGDEERAKGKKRKGKASESVADVNEVDGAAILARALDGARTTSTLASSVFSFTGIVGDLLYVPSISHSPDDLVEFTLFVSPYGRTPVDVTEFLTAMVALRSCTFVPERRVADLLKSATSHAATKQSSAPARNVASFFPKTMKMTFNELAASVGTANGGSASSYLDSTHALATQQCAKEDKLSVYKNACLSMRGSIPSNLTPWSNTDSPASTPDLRNMIDLFSAPFATNPEPRVLDCMALLDMFALALSRSNTDAVSNEMHDDTLEVRHPFAIGLCTSTLSKSVTPGVTTNRYTTMKSDSRCQRVLSAWKSLFDSIGPNPDEVLRECYNSLSGKLFLHGEGAWQTLNLLRSIGNTAATQVRTYVLVKGFRVDHEDTKFELLTPFSPAASALSSPIEPSQPEEAAPPSVDVNAVTPPSTPRARSIFNHSTVEPSPVPSPQATGPNSEKKRAAMHPTPQYQRDSADCSVLSTVSISAPIPPPPTPQPPAPNAPPKHYSMPIGQHSNHNISSSAAATTALRVTLLRDHSHHVTQCKAHTDLRNVAMVRVLESTTVLMYHTVTQQPTHHYKPCMDSHFHTTAMQWLPESSALAPIPYPTGDAARVMGFTPLTEREVIHASNAIDLTANSIHTALIRADKAFAKLFPDTMLSVSQSTLNMSSTPSNNVSTCNTSLMVDSLQTSRLTARVSPPGSQPPLNSKAKKQRCITSGDATSSYHLANNISAVLDLLLDGSTDSESEDGTDDSTLLDVGQPMPPTHFKDSLRSAITVCARLLKTSDPRQLSTLAVPLGSNEPLGTITPKPVSIHLGLVGVYMGLLLHTMSTKGDICASATSNTAANNNSNTASSRPTAPSGSSLGVAQLLNKCIVDLKRLTADYFNCVQEWLIPSLNRAYFTNAVAYQTTAMNYQPTQQPNTTVLLATHNQFLLQYMLELMLSEPRESLAQLMFVGCLIEIELPHLALDLFEFIWETERRFNAACVDPPKELSPPFHIKEWMRLTSTGGELQGWDCTGGARLAPAAPALLPPVINRQPGGAVRDDRDQALRLIRQASSYISHGRDNVRIVMLDTGDANGLTPCEVGIMGAILLPCTPYTPNSTTTTSATAFQSISSSSSAAPSPKIETLASLLLQGRAPVVCQSDFFDPTPEVLHETLQRIARAINRPSHRQ